MKKIYITGTSGTGKTTVAKELQRLGYFAISIDETKGLCSWVDQKTGEKHGGKEAEMTKDFVDLHDWVCDADYLKRLLDKKDVSVAFVLGMATNQNKFLDIFDEIILLQCNPETFIRRIEKRTDNTFGKDKDIQKQIIERSKTYAKEMLSKGAILVDTEKSVREVVEEILSIV